MQQNTNMVADNKAVMYCLCSGSLSSHHHITTVIKSITFRSSENVLQHFVAAKNKI